MTKRPTINTLANTASPTYLTQLNQNFTNVRNQFDNTLSLDGSTPNAMNADIDLNGNDLINANSVNTASLRIGGENVVASSATALAIKKEFETVALLLADTGTYTNYAVNDYLRVVDGGFVYRVAASGATNHDVTTAGGVKLYALRMSGSTVFVQQFGVITAGVDCIAIARKAVACTKRLGGGVIEFPRIGGYVFSDTLSVDFSNCVIVLDDNVTFTKTSAAAGIDAMSVFSFVGTSTVFIENVALIARRMVMVDCNGRNVVGYTYSFVAQHGITFRFCKNIRIENIYAYNGLVGCITPQFCLGGEIVNCMASHSVFDNGIYVIGNGEQIITPSETNPASWANFRLVNCTVWNCRNHGIGHYGAIGITIENPVVYNCGNNDGTSPAGPAGGIGIEFSGVIAGFPGLDFNYRTVVINPTVVGSFGFGIRTNCKGTKVIGGYVRGTKIPTNYTDTTPAIWGNGVFVQAGAVDADIECDIISSERCGVRLAPGSSRFPGLRYKGRISGSGFQGISGFGISEIVIDPSSIFENNGAAGVQAHVVEAVNIVDNPAGGKVVLAGYFGENNYGVASAFSVGEVHVATVRGKNNCKGFPSPFHAIIVENIGLLTAADILLSDANAKQSRIIVATTGITKAIIDRSSILGDQTNANLPKAQVTATTFIGELIAEATYDPPSIAAGAWGASTTVSVPGAVVGDHVQVSAQTSLTLLWVGTVTAANTVTVAPYNYGASAQDMGSNRLLVAVRKVYG